MSSHVNANSNDSAPEDAVVKLDNVWKIFGDRAVEAMDAINKEGIGKAEVLERFEAVVGVKSATFSVAQGEI